MDMVASVVSLETFAYSKRTFFMNLVFIILLILFSSLLLLIGPIDLAWLTLLLFLEIVVLLILGISPFLTDHQLSDNRLELKQGWYFKSSIDLQDIASVELNPKGPSRAGVYFKVFESSVYIATQKGQVVVLRLKKPKRFGWILGKKAIRVVFDLTDPVRFLKIMETKGVPILSNLAQES